MVTYDTTMVLFSRQFIVAEEIAELGARDKLGNLNF